MWSTASKSVAAFALLGAAHLTGMFGFTLAPARDGDPVLIGTKWVGKLTQRGEFAVGGVGPPEFDCVFTVTKRDGNTFEAELKEQTQTLKVTYIVKGEVAAAPDGKGYVIAFTSVDAKDVAGTSALNDIPYTGTVSGRVMKGTWKYAPANTATNVSGEFSFEMSK